MKPKIVITSFFLLILMVYSAQQLSGQAFRAVNDTIDLVPGFSKTVNLLANDTIPAGDSIFVIGGLGAGSGSVISTWHYQGMFTYLAPNRGVGNLIIGSYSILNASSSQTSTAHMVFRIRDNSYDTLKINDVEALLTASGYNFMLLKSKSYSPGFFVPKGSGKCTIFSNAFWIGGLDEGDTLHLAAERFRQGIGFAGNNPDFYAGPVMDTANYSLYQDTTWNYVWNLKKAEIEYHKTHWSDQEYKPIKDILSWPGNGNTALGQAAQLAPFYDANKDGIYEPLEGDYPSIRGDQALFLIFNDDRAEHKDTGGNKLRVEIHAMAYAFNFPEDTAFSKTIFLNYRIFNRSNHTYYHTYMGSFTDFEIGFSTDDFIQSDVGRGSIIGYNGKANDGNGQGVTYGAHPPSQSYTLLAGPRMAPTGTDRPRYDNAGHPICDEGVNGFGFGDGIPDNERLGMRIFSIFKSYYNPPAYMKSPLYAREYYNYMQAIWMDSTRMVYGGNGHLEYGGYGPEATFMFPGESDTLNWGCGCQPPLGPVNWTESTANNAPFDISGVGLTGPFTFFPGDMQELDIAFVWARDYTSPDTLASVVKLRTSIDTIRKAFLTNRLPGGGSFLDVQEKPNIQALNCALFPNPASSVVNINFSASLNENTILSLFNSSGRLAGSFTLKKGSTKATIDISGFAAGIYLLNFCSEGVQMTKKLSVISAP